MKSTHLDSHRNDKTQWQTAMLEEYFYRIIIANGLLLLDIDNITIEQVDYNGYY